MKTSYTMADIRDKVDFLKTESTQQLRNKCKSEVTKMIENDPEKEMDCKSFNNCVIKMEELVDKYEKAGLYFGDVSAYTNSLYNYIEKLHIESKRDEFKKIDNQFTIIKNRLKTIKNPDKAIEFLKLCGIEFPEKKNDIQPESPVDTDFIKSVLPKNLMLNSGESEANHA